MCYLRKKMANLNNLAMKKDLILHIGALKYWTTENFCDIKIQLIRAMGHSDGVSGAEFHFHI